MVISRLALAVAISSGFYAVAVFLAPAAAPLVVLVMFPGVVVAARASVAECSLWCVLTAGVIAVMLGARAVAGFVLPFGLPVLVLAVGIQRLWSFDRLVLSAAGAWCLGIAGLSRLAYGDFGAALATACEQLTRSLDVAASTYYGSFGTTGPNSVLADADRAAMVRGLLDVFPALVLLTGALAVILNLVLLPASTDRLPRVNLRLWRTPDALIWALIVTGFCMLLPVPPVALVAKNLFIVVLGCYFCQGLAIVSYYLERFRLPRGIRIAGYALISVQHVIAAVVLALGVFDLWGNFRRLHAGPADVPFHTEGD